MNLSYPGLFLPFSVKFNEKNKGYGKNGTQYYPEHSSEEISKAQYLNKEKRCMMNKYNKKGIC